MLDLDNRTVADPRLRVVYIAGSGRSGSTILCQILGELDGIFCAGELSDFWERNLGENRLCACGVEFRACKVWSRILELGMPDVSPDDARRVAELHMRIGRTQHLPFLLFPPLRGLLQEHLTEYLNHLAVLYRAIRAGTGCQVIVDSSKFPSYGWILSQVPGLELFVVHLVRDPRAVAYSWYRAEPSANAGARIEIPRFGPVASSMRWLTRNMLAESLWRSDPEHYLMLRYEDFVTDPRKGIERILDLIGIRSSSEPFVGSRRVQLGENHIVWGNRTRFLRGLTKIHPDDEWRTRIKPVPRIVVESMTWPSLRRYGYPRRVRPQADPGQSGEPG